NRERRNDAVEPFRQPTEDALDDLVAEERTGSVVYEDDERLVRDLTQRAPDRLGACRPSGDAADDLARSQLLAQQDRRFLPTRRRSDHDRVDPRTVVEAIEALGEQRTTAEGGKR